MARWIQANLRQSGPNIPARAFRTAQAAAVADMRVEGRFGWSGYALGQQVGTVAGLAILGHRGGYEGARSIAILCPERQTGFAAAVAADAGTRALLDGLAASFFRLLTGDGGAGRDLRRLCRQPGRDGSRSRR
jgi:hypothetical protein